MTLAQGPDHVRKVPLNYALAIYTMLPPLLKNLP